MSRQQHRAALISVLHFFSSVGATVVAQTRAVERRAARLLAWAEFGIPIIRTAGERGCGAIYLGS
jgi:hypothetical protein